MPEQNTPVSSGVFLSTVATMGGGRTLTKVEDALREATRAAREAGGKSKVTITLTIAPNGVGVGGEALFRVSGKVSKTLPEKPEPASNYFVDDDDNLTRRNPKQQEMKLTGIDGGAAVPVASPQQQASSS